MREKEGGKVASGQQRKPSSAINAKKKKKIEENNRMGKTRDLLKKIRNKRTFHPMMGSIKDRNSICSPLPP